MSRRAYRENLVLTLCSKYVAVCLLILLNHKICQTGATTTDDPSVSESNTDGPQIMPCPGNDGEAIDLVFFISTGNMLGMQDLPALRNFLYRIGHSVYMNSDDDSLGVRISVQNFFDSEYRYPVEAVASVEELSAALNRFYIEERVNMTAAKNTVDELLSHRMNGSGEGLLRGGARTVMVYITDVTFNDSSEFVNMAIGKHGTADFIMIGIGEHVMAGDLYNASSEPRILNQNYWPLEDYEQLLAKVWDIAYAVCYGNVDEIVTFPLQPDSLESLVFLPSYEDYAGLSFYEEELISSDDGSSVAQWKNMAVKSPIEQSSPTLGPLVAVSGVFQEAYQQDYYGSDESGQAEDIYQHDSYNDVVDCGQPPVPGDGTVKYSDTLLGSIAQYSCDDGYTSSDQLLRVCGLTGVWQGSTPVCSLIEKESEDFSAFLVKDDVTKKSGASTPGPGEELQQSIIIKTMKNIRNEIESENKDPGNDNSVILATTIPIGCAAVTAIGIGVYAYTKGIGSGKGPSKGHSKKKGETPNDCTCEEPPKPADAPAPATTEPPAPASEGAPAPPSDSAAPPSDAAAPEPANTSQNANISMNAFNEYEHIAFNGRKFPYHNREAAIRNVHGDEENMWSSSKADSNILQQTQL